MHDTAYLIGGLVMRTYCDLASARVLEVGAFDVNGSLRNHALPSTDYVGIDIEEGPGVDALIEIGKPFPFDDDAFDLVMASSVFEHDPAFWVTFIEMCRKARAGGHIYISAPANGTVHRYPQDNWRFYPDAGRALASWAQSQGQEVELVESFVADRQQDVWNDFCAVFRKGPTAEPLSTPLISLMVPCSNAHTWQSPAIYNPKEATEDMEIIAGHRQRISELESDLAGQADMKNRLNEVEEMLRQTTEDSARNERQLVTARSQTQELLAERRQLDEKLKQADRELDRLHHRVTDLETDLRLLQDEVQRSATELRLTQEERDSLHTQLDRSGAKELALRNQLIALERQRREQDAATGVSERRLEWLSRVEQVLANRDGWRSFMPPRWRRKWELRTLQRMGLFDSEAYLDRYPDVAQSGMDPLQHYIGHGMREGRVSEEHGFRTGRL